MNEQTNLFDPRLLLEVPASFEAAFKQQPKAAKAAIEDNYVTSYEPVHFTLMTWEEIQSLPPGDCWIGDVESYKNFFVVGFRHYLTKKMIHFYDAPENPLETIKLEWFVRRFTIVGFNSLCYDLPMIQLACKGMTAYQLKQASNKIIFSDYRPYQLEQAFQIKFFPSSQIDLIEIAPLRGSLKLYGGRLQCKKLQELPIDHDSILTLEQMQQIVEYNANDLELTDSLFTEMIPQITLRYELGTKYKIDLRSKSDAQIAEAIINHEIEAITGTKVSRSKSASTGFFYIPPTYLQYQSASLRAALETITNCYFTVDMTGVDLPPEISKLNIKIGKCTYKLGIGGLHSTEKTLARVAAPGDYILDRDVASYYPSIILNQELYPKHLGKAFLRVYQTLVTKRLQAKKAGDKVTADSLKITINGSFGKFGNYYSTLYSPELLIQVTMSGQLALLLLIEMIELQGIEVLSANTDGVLIYCRQDQRATLDSVIALWENKTSFVTEETQYSAIYSRDVNNYIALKTDGKVKVKGTYSERGSAGDSVLSKNPENLIVNDAVIAYLQKDIPYETTIRECKDIRRFVTLRNATGGASKSGVYLGKTIRYYYSTQMQGIITKVKSGHKLPNSEGARPVMELSKEFPEDINYPKYIQLAKEALVDLGAIETPNGYKRSIGSLFDEE